MTRRIFLIALNTFREAARNKIFYTLIFFAILLSAFSISLSTMIIGSYHRILMDMGLSIIEIFGTLIAIFVGITLVYKEIDKKTIYSILARPINRFEFVIGKFLGLWATLLVEVLIMTAVSTAIIVSFADWNEALWLLRGVSMIMTLLTMITAVAVMFSSISTPILSGMFTLGFYLIGNSSAYLPYLITKKTPEWVVKFIYWLGYVLPNFDVLNYKGAVIHHVSLGAQSYFYSFIYGLTYTAILLTIGIAGFKNRDLK